MLSCSNRVANHFSNANFWRIQNLGDFSLEFQKKPANKGKTESKCQDILRQFWVTKIHKHENLKEKQDYLYYSCGIMHNTHAVHYSSDNKALFMPKNTVQLLCQNTRKQKKVRG